MQHGSHYLSWYDDSTPPKPGAKATSPRPRRVSVALAWVASCSLAAVSVATAVAIGTAWQEQGRREAIRAEATKDGILAAMNAAPREGDLRPGRRKGLQSILSKTSRTATLLFDDGRGGISLVLANGHSVHVVRDVPPGGEQWVDNVSRKRTSGSHLEIHVAAQADTP